YNVHFGLEIAGRLDTDLLRVCLATLVERHEALRTTFLEVATYPDWVETARAVISPVGDVALKLVDLRDAEDKETQAARLTLEHRTKPFEMGRGPMWRGLAGERGGGGAFVVVSPRAMIDDGWAGAWRGGAA